MFSLGLSVFLMFLTPNKEITQQRVLYCVIREINEHKKWIKNVMKCCPHEEGSSKISHPLYNGLFV